MNVGAHEIADVLIASWILSGDGQQGEVTRIPTSHGLLDRALKKTVERNALPDWVKSNLHFVDSRTGLLCVELDSILNMAQRVNLTSAPNPTYRCAEVQVGASVARQLLRDLNISVEAGKEWGKILRAEVATALADFGQTSEPALEGY